MAQPNDAQGRTFSRRYYLFLITFLTLLSAFGAFVTDMYLPTLPSLTKIFGTTPALVQMGLAASMMGLAIGQVFFGPLSDKYGRRPVLVASMVLFAVSTVVCIYSPAIEFFNGCRFLQGLGGAGGIVLSRSVAADCYAGRELAKTMAIIGAVNGIAPVSAPVIGGLVSEAVGWQGIFWILFGLGVLLLAMCLAFRESLRKEERHRASVASLFLGFPQLLKHGRFMLYVLLFAFGNAVLFAYISSASFVIQSYFGFSELAFSILFGVNALGIGIGSALSLMFKNISKAAFCGAAGAAVCTVAQLALFRLFGQFLVYEVLLFAMLVSIGFVFTSSTTLAMEEGREHIGAASALFGAAGFLLGSIVSPLVGIGHIVTTSLSIMIACSMFLLLFASIALRRKER